MGDAGGVVECNTSRGETAVIALVPFVSQRFAIRAEQLLELDAAGNSGLYAERMRGLISALCGAFRPDAVNILTLHGFVRGAKLGGGERDAQVANEYGIEGVQFPVGAHYVALGHLHRTQRIEAPAPAWYSGSPIQVDFGEEHDVKNVLVVDASPGTPARVAAHPLRSAWTLQTLTGTLAEVREQAATVGDAWLRVILHEPTRAGLADEVRALLPRAVDVRVELPPAEVASVPSRSRRGRSPRQLFEEYAVSEGIDDRARRAAVHPPLRRRTLRGPLMRPVHLHVEGFGVFRAPVELSFDDVDYFALVGPTGAGKSTVIDAMCFALYGSIPRYDDERLVGRVVSLGSQQAKVSLTFDVGAERYRATRVVRLQKGRTGGDALLEQIAPDGSGHVLAENRKAMKAAVEQLLGLSFAHFTKCIVLPQGEFARFLHDEPARRRDLLARLLDLDVYDRVGQLARERAKEAAAAIEIEGRELEKLEFATDAARTAAEHEVHQLTLVYKAIDEAHAADDEDSLAIAELGARIQGSADHARLLRKIAVPVGIDETAAEIERAHTALRSAGETHGEATAAVIAAEVVVESAPEPSELVRAHDAHDARVALVVRVDAAEAAATRAHDELERTEKLVGGAKELVADRQHTLGRAQDAHRAHGLRAHLVAGEPCPVCEQDVAAVPKRRKPAALTKTEAALTEAHGILDAALDAQHAATTTYRDRARDQRPAAGAERDARTRDRFAPRRHRGRGRHRTGGSRTHDTGTRSRRRAGGGGRRVTVPRGGAGRGRSRSPAAPRARRTTRDSPAGRPRPARVDVRHRGRVGSPVHVERTGTSRGRSRYRRSPARARRAPRPSAKSARLSSLTPPAAVGVSVREPTLRTLREAVFERGTEARHLLVRIDEARDQAAKLREQVAAARADRDVARLLGDLLRSNRFEKWMLAEALDVLVGAASTTLFALSQGRFSLASDADEEFVVVDHANADETRSVRTLSGGETFQASLALALALSDQLASLSSAGGSKLDAIMLDEGFGSLDADTLDAVATTIEALGTEGRMVGLVTHVPALAERVPVRFRVASGAVTREES